MNGSVKFLNLLTCEAARYEECLEFNIPFGPRFAFTTVLQR